MQVKGRDAQGIHPIDTPVVPRRLLQQRLVGEGGMKRESHSLNGLCKVFRIGSQLVSRVTSPWKIGVVTHSPPRTGYVSMGKSVPL
jgi:hypothetical protein